MDKAFEKAKRDITQNHTSLGIELGSTRIKTVLIGSDHTPLAAGNFEWENQFVNEVWTYSLEDIWKGLQASYQEMAREVKTKYAINLTSVGVIGFSAMMHGYMAFDKQGELLVPFRTWRNTTTEKAQLKLTELFHYNIPQRWCIAHLYQAILDNETHVPQVDFFTTLAGYVHWKLTGEKVIGIGDASGMFPIDVEAKNYYQKFIDQFNELIGRSPRKFPWKLEQLLPTIRLAGEPAGQLTPAGAKLLDPTGQLQAGIPLCPPEGDAGTGMVATNSVEQRTGNVSVGTSAFAMIVLERELKNVYLEIDMVTTPAGELVAMVHTNNCSSEVDAWVRLFREFTKALGVEVDSDKLYAILFNKALEGDADCGGLLSYGFYSGESVVKLNAGRPLFVRSPKSNFNLANFMRMHLFSSFGALKIGMNILQKIEKIRIDKIVGHGGIFRTPEVGQRVLGAAMEAPVTVMQTAGEGGAWGMAVLGSFMVERQPDQSLAHFLNHNVFGADQGTTVKPDPKDLKGFEIFVERYERGLPIEKAAVENFLTTSGD